MTSLTASPHAGCGRFSSKSFLIAGILLAAFTEAIAGTILSLGRADIIGDTHATPDEFAWFDVGYIALKFAGFVVTPWLATHFTYRSLILVPTFIMSVVCGLAAFASGLDFLIALRMIQGLAGGVLLVSGQTLLFIAFPRGQQPIVQAIFATGSVVAPATLAPALQGFLLDSQSWHWIFLSIVPVAVSAIGLLLISNREAEPHRPSAPFDWPGFSFLFVTLACLTYVFSQGSRWDWFEEPRIAWLSATALMSLIAFSVRQFGSKRPTFLDFDVFRSEDFAFAFAASFVAGAALFGSSYLILSLAMSVLDFTPTATGALLLSAAAPFVCALLIAAALIQAWRKPPIITVPFGVLLIVAAMCMLSGATSHSGTDDLASAIVVRGFGLGFLFLSITLIAFGSLNNQAVASGIALFNVGRQLGGLIGIAALQTLIDQQASGNNAVLSSGIASGVPAVADRLTTTTARLIDLGLDPASASRAATMLLARTVRDQSIVLAFDAAFGAIVVLFAIAAPTLIAIKIGLNRLARARRSPAPPSE